MISFIKDRIKSAKLKSKTETNTNLYRDQQNYSGRVKGSEVIRAGVTKQGTVEAVETA